jgi:hypothetical protein
MSRWGAWAEEVFHCEGDVTQLRKIVQDGFLCAVFKVKDGPGAAFSVYDLVAGFHAYRTTMWRFNAPIMPSA